MTRNGPPVAGKTKTLSDMIIAPARTGHTVLCVASANTAVDLDARTVYHALGDEGQKLLKCHRFEADGADEAAILSKVNYNAYNNEFVFFSYLSICDFYSLSSVRAQSNDKYRYTAQEALNDPLMRNALEKIAIQFAELGAEMDHCIEQYESSRMFTRNSSRTTNYESPMSTWA